MSMLHNSYKYFENLDFTIFTFSTIESM